MTRSARSAAFLGALLVVGLGATACSGAAGASSGEPKDGKVQKIVVATGASPKPYTYLDDSDKLTGYDIEILRAVDKKVADLSFDFQVAEFPALFAGLDSGRFNIVANNLSANEERKKKYDFSDPYIEAQFGIVVKQDSSISKVDSLADLAGKKVYGEPGLNFTKILESYNEKNPGKKIDIEYTELDLQSQYNNLAAGNVDFEFNEQVVFDGYGKKPELKLKFIPIDGAYLTEEFGTNLRSAFAISRQTPNREHVEQEINTALAGLAKDGTLKQLSEKFFVTDYSVPKQ